MLQSGRRARDEHVALQHERRGRVGMDCVIHATQAAYVLCPRNCREFVGGHG